MSRYYEITSSYCSEENGFALFNGKVDNSQNECYQVSTGEVGWDQHTMINMWGRDMNSLVPDLSTARMEKGKGISRFHF